MPKHKTKGPLTLQGSVPLKKGHESIASLPLRVVHRDSSASGRGLPAYVSAPASGFSTEREFASRGLALLWAATC